MSSNYYAYIHNSVNREDELVEWHNKMQESMIGKNIYTREIAAQGLNVWHYYKNILGNMQNVKDASSIDVNKL